MMRGDETYITDVECLPPLWAAVNTTLIAGVFRAGGDSRFGFFCDFLPCTDEFVKCPWALKHYRGDKWLKNITREEY